MSGGNRPRLFRSVEGCCVCGAKSSSSRFTESVRYENNFEQCFRLDPAMLRSTEICNACVLLVKRYRRLPVGAKRSWPHVVGARAGPGLKSMLRIKNRQTPSHHRPVSSWTTATDLTLRPTQPLSATVSVLTSFTSRRNLIFKSQQPLRRSPGRHWFSVGTATSWPRPHSRNSNNNGFIDPDYWHSKRVCCGVIFTGQYNDVLIDTQLLNLCNFHRLNPGLPFHPVQDKAPLIIDKALLVQDEVPLTYSEPASPHDELLCPSASVDSGNVSPSSSSVDELMDDAETEPSNYSSYRLTAIDLSKSLSSLHRKHITPSSSLWPAESD